MLSYQKWKQLNESFAGAMTLGVSTPGSLGVLGGRGGTEAFAEAKKKSKKMMADVELGDEEDDGDGVGECSFCKKKSAKKSKKFMGSEMDDFAAGPPHKLGKKKPFGKPGMGDDELDPDAMGDEDMGDLDDPDAMGDEDMGDLDDPDAMGDEDMGDLDDPDAMGDEDMGDDMGGDGDLDDPDAMDDEDMGDDISPAMGHPKAVGGPLNKKKKPKPDFDMMGGAFMKKKMKKKMKKEAMLHNDEEWMASVKSMLTPTNQKFNDGWTEYQEDRLLAPAPAPGEVGYAPQQRLGGPLGGEEPTSESRRRK